MSLIILESTPPQKGLQNLDFSLKLAQEVDLPFRLL